MRDHHKRIIEKLFNKYKDDERFVALILVGSIAKGKESDKSDVDIILVAADEEFLKRKKIKDYNFFDYDISDYPEVYVDAKIVNIQFLIDAAERGNEPTRAGFTGAIIVYSRNPNLESIIKQIPIYQIEEKKKKVNAFYNQLGPSRFFASEAEERNNQYLLLRMVSDIVLFGCRIILAQNNILFISHKRLLDEVENSTKKPEGIIKQINKLIEEPKIENIDIFIDEIMNYDGWDVKPEICVGTFIENDLWGWITGNSSVSDW